MAGRTGTTPDVAEILAHHTRGGFPYTRVVSQRLAAPVTRVGAARGWRPAAVTLGALATSLVTSGGVALLGHGVAASLVAVVGWQVAYVLDCADGQLARATGRTSAAGAALDLYADWVGRIAMAAAVFASLAARDVAVPLPVVVLLTGALLSGLHHEAVNRVGAVEDLPPSRARDLLGVVRDPGVTLLLVAAVVALPPTWGIAALGLVAALGAVKLAVRLGRIVARSWEA